LILENPAGLHACQKTNAKCTNITKHFSKPGHTDPSLRWFGKSALFLHAPQRPNQPRQTRERSMDLWATHSPPAPAADFDPSHKNLSRNIKNTQIDEART
jgi:hypothetical protein